VRKAVLLASCVLLTACGNENLLATGLDTSLYVTDTTRRAELQQRYFALMCMRAGVAPAGASLERPACPTYLSPEDWQQVVYAALNDIDDRCEVYLKSLDNAKKDRAAFLARLRATASTTALILTATGVPGSAVGAKAIAIVEAAFGFAEHSLDNYYSRLLLEVETATVHNLVLKIQTAYRVKLKTDYLPHITNSPAAYHAIRNYIRICLPASIEASITANVDDATYLDIPPSVTGYTISRNAQGARRPRVITRNDPTLESLERR